MKSDLLVLGTSCHVKMPDGEDVCAVAMAGKLTVEIPRLTVPTNLRIDIVRAVMVYDGMYGSLFLGGELLPTHGKLTLIKRRS